MPLGKPFRCSIYFLATGTKWLFPEIIICYSGLVVKTISTAGKRSALI